jgi:Ca2+/Na+ antiporter
MLQSCVLGLLPCSITITGNLVLIIFYGALLGVAAKVISDGAEMLLDLGLPATLIGGIVLPLLGAVPDSAMIIASGIGGSKDHANKQIAVGMGTLAGSTIMLLTLPWLGSIILGRVDIVHGQGIDGVTKKFTIMSFLKQVDFISTLNMNVILPKYKYILIHVHIPSRISYRGGCPGISPSRSGAPLPKITLCEYNNVNYDMYKMQCTYMYLFALKDI